jgi:hypothetical protein
MLMHRFPTLRVCSAGALLLLLSCGGEGPGTTEPDDNPVPVLSTLSRDTATGGIPQFTITLRGSGFMVGAAGTVDGNARSTNVTTDSTASLTITAVDLGNAGAHQVRLKNPDPTEGPSAPLTFTVLAAPVPVVDSLSPDTIAAGAPAFTLHVHGSGFLPQSVIKWGGTSLVTTRVDGTHLSAPVSVLQVATPANTNVTVFTPAPGGGTSSPRVFVVPPLPVVTGIDPDTVVVGPDTIPLTVFGHGFRGADSVRIENQANIRWYPALASTDTTVLIALDRSWLSALGLLTVQVMADAGISGHAHFETTNPTPVITSVTPDTIDGTKGADTLVVTGSGFVPGMGVRLVGLSNLPTTYLDYNHLRAVVSADFLVYGGVRELIVYDPLELRTSDTLSFGIRSPIPHADSIGGIGYTILGNAGATISLYGTGFVYGGEFLVNGASRPVGALLPGRAVLGLLAEDVDSAGTLNIQYHSFGPGGGSTAVFTHQVVAPNPIPSVIAADRTLLVADSGDLTVTFTGHDFLAGVVIELADGPYDYHESDTLSTTWVSDSVVTAVVPSARLGKPERYWFRARNPEPTLGVSPSIAIEGASTGVLSLRSATGIYLDLASDPVGARLWAITTTGAQFGHQYLVAIDPVTAAHVDSTELLNGGYPLTVASDGSRIYVATFNGPIEEYDATTLALLRTIPLGVTPDSVPMHTYAIVASRSDPDLIALVAFPNSPSSMGMRVALFRDGAALPAVFDTAYPGSDAALAFGEGDSSLVVMTATSNARLYHLAVGPTGVTGVLADTVLPFPGGGQLLVAGNTVHTSNGYSLDLTTGGLLAWRDSYTQIGLIASAHDPLVAYSLRGAYPDPSTSNWSLEIVGVGTGGAITSSIKIVPPPFNFTRRLVRWGTDGFAFAGTGILVIGRSTETDQ